MFGQQLLVDIRIITGDDMTIQAYTGIPGSGKSAHAARVIRESLDRRYPRPVIANFPLADGAMVPEDSRRYYHYYDNEHLTPRVVEKFANDYWASGERAFDEDIITLIYDEAQVRFNSRRWAADKDRWDWLEFLTQHRKYGIRVILVTQNLQMIDNQFRFLVDTEYNHRRVSTLGLVARLISLPFGNRFCICVRNLYQAHERLSGTFLLFNKRDFSMYDSYAKFKKQE